MKKIFTLVIILLTVISCQITERFILQETGSVVYESEVDFSEMAEFMFSQTNLDSLRQLGEFPMDTIITYNDVHKLKMLNMDSITPQEKEILKEMDISKIRMVMNEKKSFITLTFEKNSIQEMNDHMDKIQRLNKEIEKMEKEGSKEDISGNTIIPFNVSYDGKTFKRHSGFYDMIKEESDSALITTEEALQMYGYKFEYHFPKKVKTVSIEDAQLSLDGKTVIIETKASELLKDPEKYNFTVEFE